MNFLKKLFGIGSSPSEKPQLKKTAKVQAALDRIEARKQKELQESSLKLRKERGLKSREQLAQEAVNQQISEEEQLRRLKKRAQKAHNDRLQADSGLTANSKLDLWMNTVTPGEAPDTIAPHLRIPETVFNVETNKFETKAK